MKKISMLFALLIGVATAFAQMPPDSKPDAQLTCEEADMRIADFETQLKDLQSRLDMTNEQLNQLKTNLENAKKNYMDCQEAIRKLLGVTDADIDAFRQQLGQLEGKVRRMEGMTNDELADRRNEVAALEKELNELRMNNIAIMPEFFNKVIDLAKRIRALYREKKIKSYIVGTWAEDRDCLWNIAGKMEIYGDPFQWPKIWYANKDEIRNPDIIFPGQELMISPKGAKSDEEMKMERRYWREKKEQMEMEAQTGGENMGQKGE